MHFIATATHWNNQTLSWLHPSFHAQEPLRTIAPMLLLYSGADNRIPKALLQLRNIPLCIDSPTYNNSHTHWRDYCMFSYIWPWLQKPLCVYVCVCADSAACQWLTWLLSCAFTGFTDLHAQQPGDLKTRERGWYWGEGWVTYHLMLPLLHNPTLSNGGKLLMRPWSRTIEDRKREREKEEGETAPFFGVSMQTPDKARLPFFTKFVFSRLAFWLDQHSNERLRCPKALFESRTKQSAIVSFVNMQLLLCTCRETQGIRIKFSSLRRRKVSSLPPSHF